MPMCANNVDRMFLRWPSSGGCSFSMSWVSATAALAMSVVSSLIAPSSPMFSPAADQCTPAAVSRSPIAGSPGHWWDRPQPWAISRLCWEALVFSPEENDSAGRPFWDRAWLIRASTWSAGVPCCEGLVPVEPVVGDDDGAVLPGDEGEAEADAEVADGSGCGR